MFGKWNSKGFLTGAINESTTFDSTDFRNIVPRFSPEARKANQVLVDLLGRIARERPHRLEENIGAAPTTLSEDDLRKIGDALSQITVFRTSRTSQKSPFTSLVWPRIGYLRFILLLRLEVRVSGEWALRELAGFVTERLAKLKQQDCWPAGGSC